MSSEEIWEENVHALHEKVVGTAFRQSGKPSSTPSAMDEDPPYRKRPSPGGQKSRPKRQKAGGGPDDDGDDEGDDDEGKDRGGPKGSLPTGRMPKNVEMIVRLLSSYNPSLDDGLKSSTIGRRDLRTEMYGHGVRNHPDFIVANSRVGHGCIPTS